MQRECNNVAFGELILSTKLNINMKLIHPKSEIKDVVEACNSWTCHVDELLHKRVLPSQTSTWANTSSLHKPVHQLFKHESCFGDFELDKISDVSNQPNWEGKEITAARRQAGGHVLMTTNRRPLIMMWSKTAPKGTKRAKVASTTMMWLAKSTGLS